MKLVIDIPNEVYDWHVNGFPDEEDAVRLLDIVKNGTPLEDSEDCVSRQAVLDYIYNDLGLGDEENGKDVERQMELENSYRYVKSLPPVTPAEKAGRWIPVSERLPEDDEDVLACYPQGEMEVVYYHIDNSIYPTEYEDLNETGWYNEEGDALYFEPIAWMPLPEPYKASPTEAERRGEE